MKSNHGTTPATTTCVDPVLLRRALRLVHCLQKERGASCAFYSSLQENMERVERARVDSDRSIQMILSGRGEFKVHSTLMKIRKMVEASNQQLAPSPRGGRGSSCHRILVCFNALISSIVHDYFMEKIALQEKTLQQRRGSSNCNLCNRGNHNNNVNKATPEILHRKTFSSKNKNGKKGHHRARSMGDALLMTRTTTTAPSPPPPPPPPRNARVTSGSAICQEGSMMRLDNNLPPLPFHGLPHNDPALLFSSSENLSHRRAKSELSPHKNVQFNMEQQDPDPEEVLARLLNLLACFVKLKESTGVERAVLSSLIVSGKEDSLLLSDLVLEVENQRRLLDELMNLPFGSLRNLVEELVEMSQPLRKLQQKILKNFDLEGIIINDTEEHDVNAVWDLITVYIDKLHSLELLIIEEIEYCLPSIEWSHSHDSICAKRALLESDFIVGLFGKSTSEEDVRNSLEKMPAEELKTKLLEGLVPRIANGEINNNNSHEGTTPTNGVHASTTSTINGDVVDDPLLMIPNLPASKEWEVNLYELKFLKRIGEGAAGTTYLAKWTGLQVAVKVASITETGLEGWRTEVQALQKLHHPNIIRLLGSVYHPNPLTFCLVLEYCNAGDLATALKYPTAPGFFLHVATSVAKGVAYLHSRGVMHRDIKPENILCDGNVKSGNFQVKVSDFGVATDTSILGDRTAETGTYRWMAPEVLRHESYSNMADVYSFAVVLWQLVTREDPYANVSQIEAAGKVALEIARPPFPSDTPEVIKSAIQTCWSENPDDRWSFEEICDKLPAEEAKLTTQERKWLDAPLGQPVYYPRQATQEEMATPVHPASAVQRKREDKPKERKSGFFKIKMFGH